MSVTQLLELAGQFGPMGLFVGYLIWDKIAERRDKREEEVGRQKVAEARVAADLELAKALTILTVTIQGRK